MKTSEELLRRAEEIIKLLLGCIECECFLVEEQNEVRQFQSDMEYFKEKEDSDTCNSEAPGSYDAE